MKKFMLSLCSSHLYAGKEENPNEFQKKPTFLEGLNSSVRGFFSWRSHVPPVQVNPQRDLRKEIEKLQFSTPPKLDSEQKNSKLCKKPSIVRRIGHWVWHFFFEEKQASTI